MFTNQQRSRKESEEKKKRLGLKADWNISYKNYVFGLS